MPAGVPGSTLIIPVETSNVTPESDVGCKIVNSTSVRSTKFPFSLSLSNTFPIFESPAVLFTGP